MSLGLIFSVLDRLWGRFLEQHFLLSVGGSFNRRRRIVMRLDHYNISQYLNLAWLRMHGQVVPPQGCYKTARTDMPRILFRVGLPRIRRYHYPFLEDV